MSFIHVLYLTTVVPLCVTRRCSSSHVGMRCSTPGAFWQKDRVCVFSGGFKKPSCILPHPRNFSFMLVAAISAYGKIKVPNSLWLRGAGPGLYWERTIKMKRLQKGFWGTNISYTYGSDSILCLSQHMCSLNQKALEFRVYRDSAGKRSMNGPNFYVKLPVSNSIVNSVNFKPPFVYFFPSFYGKKVWFKHFQFENLQHFIRKNQLIGVTLFYPPSYLYNVHKRYPVVIVLGKNLHNQMVPLLESMYVYESNIEEAFVVAVRTEEQPPYCSYNPFIVLDEGIQKGNFLGNHVWNCQSSGKSLSECKKCMTCYSPLRQSVCDVHEFATRVKDCNNKPDLCQGRGGAILDSIENIVLPELTLRTLSRMLSDFPRERVSIIGIDGGGLLACFAALTRPSVYKNAACLSAPFHWPLRSLKKKENREKQGIGLVLNQVAERMKLYGEARLLYSTQKYYIDVDPNDNKYLPIVNAYNYSDWVVMQLRSKLNLKPANLLYFPYVNGTGNSHVHFIDDGDLRMIDRIKTPLQYFLKPEGGLSEEYPRLIRIGGSDYADRKLLVDSNYSLKNITENADVSSDCEKYLPKIQPTISINTFHICIGKSVPPFHSHTLPNNKKI